MNVTVGVSARHVHLSRETLDILFGEGYELTKYRDLSQIGQFASNEKITIKTDKDKFDGVRILGPIRNYTQVEISRTDAYKLGLNPPIRESGDLEGSEIITLIGPKGEVTIKEGCIIATRHIHINPKERHELGLDNVESVNVEFDGEKGGILYNVSIKEGTDYVFEMHIDTDDANAFLLKSGSIGKIIKKEK